MHTKDYRYPGERLILTLTFLAFLLVIALTASATVCASGLFFLAFVLVSLSFSISHHKALMKSAERVNVQKNPELAVLLDQGKRTLQTGPIEVYIVPSNKFNAYTFGLTSSKVVVLYSALFKIMDRDELEFVVGHEFGHIALGHTWLNSIVGGMAGVPASWSAGALLSLAFLWWNRACELSADRAGLLACGNLDKAISALVKIGAVSGIRNQHELETAYYQIDLEDDNLWGNLNETLTSHPMLIRRINELRKFAASNHYRSDSRN